MNRMQRRVAVAVALLLAGNAAADTVTVAVASNFATTAEALAEAFASATAYDVRLVRGSSGKLYAQIVNGAPVDIFLSADAERPRELESRGRTVPGSRFTYAIGQLVIWSRDSDYHGRDCRRALATTAGRVAIANPRLAPYGAAAKQYLEREALWDKLESQLVYGENIAQTLQFAATGNASVAIVARSQLGADGVPAASCTGDVPADAHDPVVQQGVLVDRAAGNEAASAFMRFLSGEEAHRIIRAQGYAIPDAGAAH